MRLSLQFLFVLILLSQTAVSQWQNQGLSAENDNLWGKSTAINPSLGGPGSIGIRAGIGTDINLGLAYGGGINYLLDLKGSAVELGFVVFGGHSEETTEEFNTYTEKTDVLVFGVLSNYLFGYKLKKSSLFGVIGLGFAAISVDWEESSPNDISLGTPLPGGGSKQSSDGTGAGSVFNLGFGMSFNGGLDIRAEAPVIFIFGPPGSASSIVPTFMATIGYHF
jgi:hypothetical protein